jgi:hypothetical protein
VVITHGTRSLVTISARNLNTISGMHLKNNARSLVTINARSLVTISARSLVIISAKSLSTISARSLSTISARSLSTISARSLNTISGMHLKPNAITNLNNVLAMIVNQNVNSKEDAIQTTTHSAAIVTKETTAKASLLATGANHLATNQTGVDAILLETTRVAIHMAAEVVATTVTVTKDVPHHARVVMAVEVVATTVTVTKDVPHHTRVVMAVEVVATTETKDVLHHSQAIMAVEVEIKAATLPAVTVVNRVALSAILVAKVRAAIHGEIVPANQ